MPATALTIRPATLALSDHKLLLDLKDSQLDWLGTIGSSAQWGTAPSRSPSVTEKALSWVQRSEQKSPWSSTGNWCRAFIASASETPVAALVLEAHAPAYVNTVVPETDEKEPFVYLAYLISNGRAGEERKGAGAGLIGLAKEETRKVGVKRLCLDCWGGNGGRLVR